MELTDRDLDLSDSKALDSGTVAAETFRLINVRDLDGLAALQHDDIVDEFLAVSLVARGKREVRDFFEELLAAVPDFHLEIERLTSTGDHAYVQWQARGTFTGTDFQGFVATGRPLDLRGVDCMRVEDGLLRHNVIYYDGLAFARQIGLLPAEDSVSERALTGAFNARTRVLKMLRIGG